MIDEAAPSMRTSAEAADHPAIIRELARFVEPVERFFADVLVIDANDGRSTRARYDLLLELRDLLTRYFDIRELAGQAERRPS